MLRACRQSETSRLAFPQCCDIRTSTASYGRSMSCRLREGLTKRRHMICEHHPARRGVLGGPLAEDASLESRRCGGARVTAGERSLRLDPLDIADVSRSGKGWLRHYLLAAVHADRGAVRCLERPKMHGSIEARQAGALPAPRLHFAGFFGSQSKVSAVFS